MVVIPLTRTTVGDNLLRDGLTGADNPRITYFAIGSGTSTPTSAQTKLDNETFRKAVTSFTNGGSTGQALINCFLSDSDAVGLDVEEIAVFGGTSATTTANTGKMLGRAKWAHNPKTAIESIQLQLDITV